MTHTIATRTTLLALRVSACTLLADTSHGASAYPAQGSNGMVASAHHIPTDAGRSIVWARGVAVDAAVADGYALAVTLPQDDNLGGGSFMLAQTAEGRETMIDLREFAPLVATPNMFLDANDDVAGDAARRSWPCVAVPGVVAGLERGRAEFGTQSLNALQRAGDLHRSRGFLGLQWDDEVHFAGMLTAAFRVRTAGEELLHK